MKTQNREGSTANHDRNSKLVLVLAKISSYSRILVGNGNAKLVLVLTKISSYARILAGNGSDSKVESESFPESEPFPGSVRGYYHRLK
jgi:hypothetical protein